MQYWRKFCLILLLAGLGIVASLLPARLAGGQEDNAPAQLDRATELAALQRGTLEVWAPQTFIMGRFGDPTARVVVTYQWQTLLDEFKRDFPDFDLRFKILVRDDFVRAFHSPGKNPAYPDMAFLDNQSERGPLMDKDALIQMLGRPRFRYNGWWTIFRETKNLEAGRAFLLWLAQSPHWKPLQVTTAALSPQDSAAVQSIAKEAFGAMSIPTLIRSRRSWMNRQATSIGNSRRQKRLPAWIP
jgi:hypothetical protein